jgi:acyl carrier protein
MSKTEKVLEIMLDAFKEISEQDTGFDIGQCKDEMILFGAGATIDSLTLVSLIVDLESKISENFLIEISLTDDRAMTREISPFDTFGSLRNYIEELISEN